MFAVVGTIAASAAFDFAAHGIAIIGPVPGGLPSIALPAVTWSETLALLPVAASCFVMIIAQSAATSRVFAVRYHERVDEDADILGLSAANAAAAVSGAFVVNGSPTQTAMADRAGARSQIAQLVFAGVVLLVLLFFTGPLQYLPRCVLAAIVFTIAVGMIDVEGLRDIRRESPGEFILPSSPPRRWSRIGVEQGILLAVVFSLLRHVRHSYRPHTMVLRPDAAGDGSRCRRRPACRPSRDWSSIVSAPICSTRTITASPTKCARWSSTRRRRCAGSSSTPGAITDIDYSAARSVRDLLDDLARRGSAWCSPASARYLRSDMDRHGITAALGETRDVHDPARSDRRRAWRPARTIDIGGRRPHALAIVAEQPERGVALVAQEPAHLSRRVAMIDAEGTPGWQLADGADAVLLVEQPAVLLAAEAISPAQSRATVACAQAGIRAPLVTPLRVEPIAVLRAIGAVGRELFFAILSIFGISPPVLFVAESHRRSRQYARPDRPHRTQARQKAPGSRGEKAYERAVEARGAVRAAQAGAYDHGAPKPGRCMAPPKRSDAIFNDGVSIGDLRYKSIQISPMAPVRTLGGRPNRSFGRAGMLARRGRSWKNCPRLVSNQR